MPAKRLLCLTPNPAIDRTLVVPGFRPGRVARAREAWAAGGGKGVNVARAARLLGLAPILAGPLGGPAGQLVAELTREEGLAGQWTPIAGATRTCIVVVDPEAGESTVINEPGPALTPEEWKQLCADAVAIAQGVDAVALSGSLPAALGPDDLGTLVAALAATGRPVWVDNGGPALLVALVHGPDGVKVNAQEAAAALGVEGTPADLARRMLARGAKAAIVTDGPREAVWADAAGTWRARPPEVQALNATGCGDAFLAGLLAGITQGWSAPETLRYATAVGAAAALGLTASRFDRQDLDRLLPLVAITS